MASKDLHSKPFDEETITKLEIFENYTQEWLPTFIMQGIPEIFIFDFFAGTGYDKAGVAGSPIRLLKKIEEQIGNMFQKSVHVTLFLNEFEPVKKVQAKFDLLKASCDTYLEEHPRLKHKVQIKYYNEDFEQLFSKLLPEIKKVPSLVFMDQNGIKFTSEKYFLELEKTTQTDFLYFISSSYFWRFGKQKEFVMHLDIDMEAAKKDPYKFIHRNVIEQIRAKLPIGTKLRLYPFSLRRGQNIHGIIFGAKHPRAVDKFLGVAWEKNAMNGQANFDIDDDISKNQLPLFGAPQKKRIGVFQEQVREKILKGEITNNKMLYDFTLGEGHIANHASDAVKKMKKDGELRYESTSPLANYDNAYKNPRLLTYEVLKKR
ncbi:three-Cys-motif partner protein TcmP [Daejeonella sp.]|uniref:three-Cys-motif partner protein TcmP n=1 Tax=Daejeonella sp. TaxID=2805397 RepID=UPI0030BFA08B